MKNIILSLTVVFFAVGCVVQKDSKASAQVSAELAKQLAQSLSKSSSSYSVQPGQANAAQPGCTSTVSGTTTSITCNSGGIELQFSMTLTSSSSTGASYTLSGYEKLTNFSFVYGGKTDTVNGTITISGNLNVNLASLANFSSTTTQIMNGKLTVTGGDNFTVEYKGYQVAVTSSYVSGTYSYNYSCSGKIAVDGIDFAVNSDCSIAN